MNKGMHLVPVYTEYVHSYMSVAKHNEGGNWESGCSPYLQPILLLKGVCLQQWTIEGRYLLCINSECNLEIEKSSTDFVL